MDVNDYLSKISDASNRYGDKLLSLMQLNNKKCLRDITLEEAKSYYEMFIKEDE